ncbi:MAG: PEP-CTERM sorting domain-containing protein, partial [Pyrinomonadaceae bacterium]
HAQSPNAGYHVTICHRTGSASNPYVRISPNVEGVIKGHLDHDQTGNGLGGDIIPVFVYKGVTYSKNLSSNFGEGMTGSQVIANGCFIPKGKTPTPTPPATPTPPGMTPTPPPPPPPTPPPTPPTPVPEPMTILLFGTGLASIGMAARRKLGWTGNKDSDTSEE